MVKHLLLASLLALAIGAVDWTAPAAPRSAQAASGTVLPASAGTLLFVKGNDIWTMAADGSGQTQLTYEANDKFANHAVFSPDGTKIAYASHTLWTQQSFGAAESTS